MSEPDTCDGCTGRVRGEDYCACQKAAIARKDAPAEVGDEVLYCPMCLWSAVRAGGVPSCPDCSASLRVWRVEAEGDVPPPQRRFTVAEDEPFWKRARMPGYQAETDRIHARPEGVIVVRPLTPAEWDAYMERRR